VDLDLDLVLDVDVDIRECIEYKIVEVQVEV
jgi:hypothetical protein